MGIINIPELFQLKEYESKTWPGGFTIRKKTRTAHDSNPVASAVVEVLPGKRTSIIVTVRPGIGSLLFFIVWFGIVGLATLISWWIYFSNDLPVKPEQKQPIFLTVVLMLSYGLVMMNTGMIIKDYKRYLITLLLAEEEQA